MSNIKNRRIDLDIAKGLGIIMVVWAHAGGPFSRYINQFHMPFFFFVSGLLYSSREKDIKSYAKRKVKSLLMPFWCWNLVLYPVFFVLYYWKNWEPLTFLREVLEIVLTVNKVAFLGPTWFLASLFWISVLMHLYICKFDRYKWCDAGLLIIGSTICVLGFATNLPYHWSRTLILVLFYVCGYLYKKYLADRIRDVVKNILSCVGGIVYICIATINTANMSSHEYEYRVLFIIGAFLAIAFTVRLSKWIAECPILAKIGNHIAYLGRNSLHIVIWHVLAFRVTIILQMFIGDADIKDITAFPVYDASGIWWVVYLLTGIYGTLIWKYILEHNPLTPWMKKVHMI